MSKTSNQQKVVALQQWLKWVESKAKRPRRKIKYHAEDDEVQI